MAAVSIDSGPVEAEDRLQDVPQEKWRDLLLARRTFLEIRLPHDCRCLVQFVDEAQEMYAALGYESPEAMVERGYGLSAGDVVIASTWLRRNKPDTPVSLPDVLSAEAFDRAQVHPAYVHADVDNIHIIERPSGTSRRRSLRRLRDQRPDLHRRVLAGELSPHAAMLEAGFRRPTFTVPADNMQDLAAALVRHLDHQQIEELRKALG